MNRVFRAVGRGMVLVMTAVSILAPLQGDGAPGQFISSWPVARVSPILEVPFPAGNWTDIAKARGVGGAAPSLEMIQGEKWITLGREEVGMLGLSSNQVGDTLKQFPGGTMQVFARYSPENAMLQITLVRVEQRPDGIVYVSRGDWTPHHGEFLRGYRNYLTATERADQGRAGFNPFQSFRGDNTDPVFYNISFGAALVAIGAAMRMNRAPTAWLAVSNSRLDVRNVESGNLFRKKVTTIVDGRVAPIWYFVSPAEMQPYGGVTAQICADPSQVVPKPGSKTGETMCDDPAHVVKAGVVATEWRGGNMPSQEDTVYHWETTSSGWTVLTFAIITGVLAWAGGAVYGAAVGGGAGGGGAIGGTIFQSGLIAGLTPAQLGSLAGGLYAAGSTGFGNNAGLTSAQSQFAGSTGTGVLHEPVPTTIQERALQGAVRTRQVDQLITAGLTGTQQLYMGNCPESLTLSQCRAVRSDPGALGRTDTFARQNTTLRMRSQYEACTKMGYRGAALDRCAAPTPAGAFSQPR